MKWDQQRPAKAAVERCQGCLRLSTSPPQEFLSPFSYTHRPGRSGAHGPAGSGVDFPIPQNSFCMGFAKNGLASSQPPLWPREPIEERWASHSSAGCRGKQPVLSILLPTARPPLCLLPSHIPTDQGAVSGTARRALG